MTTLQARVKALLEDAGLPVRYGYPAAWREFPCVSWSEAGNRALAQADGREYLTELTYAVDIWAETPGQLAEAGAAIDLRLSEAGLRRTSCLDLYEDKPRLHHRALRYRAVTDPEGRTYQ